MLSSLTYTAVSDGCLIINSKFSLHTISFAGIPIAVCVNGGICHLIFDGYGWHRLHNVEITISESDFSESVRTKTDDRGHLNMPWPIPETVGGRVYHIFATDGIHEYDIDVPISPKAD